MRDLTEGNIYKTFFLFGLPLVLSGLLTQAYGIINSAIAGKFLGETGLGAIGATAPLDAFVNSIFWGFGVGVSVYLARLFSAKKNAELKASFTACYILMAVGVLSVEGLLVIFYKPLEKLLQIGANLRRDAFLYFVCLRLAEAFSVLNTYTINTLNGMGVSGYTFGMSVLSSILNIVFNLLFVVVLHTGVWGLALASVLALAAVNVGYLIKIRQCFHDLPCTEEVKPCLSLIKPMLPYALPNTAQQGSMYLVGLLISPLVNKMGVDATASYAVVLQIYNLIAYVYQNSTKAVSNYVAQCIGSNKMGQIKKSLPVGLLQSTLFALPFVLACVIFYKPVCELFFKADASLTAKTYTYAFVRQYLPFIFFNIVCNLFHGFYRGAKAVGHLFSMSLFASIVRYIVSVCLMPSMGMYGFYLGWTVSWIAEAFVNTILFFIGKWQPKEKARE